MSDLDDRTLGELLIAEFDRLTVDDVLRALLAEGIVGGMILFARNIGDVAQALTRDLRAAAATGALDPAQVGAAAQRVRALKRRLAA